MVLVKPSQGRAQVNDKGKLLEIVIPVKRSIFFILFIGFWLCGWAFGEVEVILQLFRGSEGLGFGNLFMLAWLGGWTVGGVLAIIGFGWNLTGREVITVSEDRLQIRREIFGLSMPKEYLLSEVKNFRVENNPMAGSMFGKQATSFSWGFTNTGIAKFDYGMKVVRFGEGLEETEAAFIINKIKSRLA